MLIRKKHCSLGMQDMHVWIYLSIGTHYVVKIGQNLISSLTPVLNQSGDSWAVFEGTWSTWVFPIPHFSLFSFVYRELITMCDRIDIRADIESSGYCEVESGTRGDNQVDDTKVGFLVQLYNFFLLLYHPNLILTPQEEHFTFEDFRHINLGIGVYTPSPLSYTNTLTPSSPSNSLKTPCLRSPSTLSNPALPSMNTTWQ